jgi:phosphate uptake regulator
VKRRVILMGGKTYVLSLPSQWVKKYRIQKGEELELEEKQDSIVIKRGKCVEGGSIDVDFSKLDKMFGRAIGALYKGGYSQVKIRYNSKEQLQIIEETLQRSCIGFEITKQENNYVIIESITEVKKEEFDASLKRLFFSLEAMGSDLVACRSENDFRKVIEKDGQINRLADFCRRVINKEMVIEKPALGYYIVEQLERIGDIYKRFAKLQIGRKGVTNDETKGLLIEINKLFVRYRELFYNFSYEKFEDFGRDFFELREEVKLRENSELVYLLYSIFDMNGVLLIRNL